MKSKYRLYTIIAVLAILLIIMSFGMFRSGAGGLFSSKTVINNSIMIEDIKKLGRLELVRLDIRDIVETVKDNQILPDEKVLLIVYGEVTAGIDFTKINESDIQLGEEKIVVALPKPEIFSVKVNHEKSHVYDTKMGFLSTGGIISAELIDQAYKSAESTMGERAKEMDFEGAARGNGEKLLKPLLERISGKTVEFIYK